MRRRVRELADVHGILGLVALGLAHLLWFALFLGALSLAGEYGWEKALGAAVVIAVGGAVAIYSRD